MILFTVQRGEEERNEDHPDEEKVGLWEQVRLKNKDATSKYSAIRFSNNWTNGQQNQINNQRDIFFSKL